MPLTLDEKKSIVMNVHATAEVALSLVIADARGVSVSEMTKLRADARPINVKICIVRNTLAKRAFEGTDFECVQDALRGPSLFAFSMDDPGAAARLLKDFAKANENFQVKSLSIAGKLLDGAQVDVLANLPTRIEALGMLAVVTLAPVNKLVRTLNEIPTKATRVIAAIREAKEQVA
tara:strand:+ start:1169 stop:1699 length:531 start_codon:yes stop_codon:yes gene_type:complete